MRRIHIIETEYLALLGFCLWDDGELRILRTCCVLHLSYISAVPGLSKEAKSLAVQTQSKLLAELQNFYSSQVRRIS